MDSGSNIPPSLGGTVPPTAGSRNVIGKVPSGLATLPQGGLLNALVVRHDASGNPVLATQNGEFTVSSRIPLPTGSNLVLKLLSSPPHLQSPPSSGSSQADINAQLNFRAQVISIDGKAPNLLQGNNPAGTADTSHAVIKAVAYQPGNSAGVAPAGNTAQTQLTTTSPASNNAAVVNISNGTILESVVVNPSADAAKFLPVQSQSASTGAVLKTADHVTLHVISSSVPDTRTTGQPSRQSPQISGSPEAQRHISAYSNSGSGKPISGNNPLFSSGTIPSLTATPAQSPVTSSLQITPITQNPSFTGVVVGTEQSGEVVVKTPIGMVKLPADITLPQGTRLQLEAVQVARGEQAVGTGSASTPLPASSALQELATTLAAIDAKQGTSITHDLFPATNKQAAAKTLWFLVNVNNGDVSSWLGASAKKLLERPENRDLLGRLERSFASMKAGFSEPNSAGWNNMLLPFHDGDKLRLAQLHIHRDNKRNRKGTGQAEDVRFVVEVELENIGDLQMDGLVRNLADNEKKQKKLDLFIRTTLPLEVDIQQGITRIFTDSMEISGMDGALQFQTVDQLPLHSEFYQHDDDGGIIV